MRFYWECQDQEYVFDKSKKYLIYYRGGFCPPTRGHFSLVEKYIKYPNVNYFIHQIGNESRHGVPYNLNRKIWKIYIKELLDEKRIMLQKCGSTRDVVEYIDKSEENYDVVVYIRGNEDYNPRQKSREIKKRYSDLIKSLNRRGIDMDFIYLDRPLAHVLSASKFIEALNKPKKKYHKLRYYLPKNLSDKGVKYIVHKLRKYNLR